MNQDDLEAQPSERVYHYRWNPQRDINYVPGKKDKGIEYFRYRLPAQPRRFRAHRPKRFLSLDRDIYDVMKATTFYGPAMKKVALRRKALKRFLAAESKSLGQTYRDYLKSDKWKYFRDAIIIERGSMCERCGKSSCYLNVHHLSYVRLGNELPEDVKVYCLPCHKAMHPGWD
jgi:hypothetical protein